MKLSAVVSALAAASVGAADFGAQVESMMSEKTMELFGFEAPIAFNGSGKNVPRKKGQSAFERQLLAKGLNVEFVARNVATDADMLSFWPSKSYYTHLIICIEGGRAEGGINAGVQRVNVVPGANYGKVETIVFGMSRCDGIRTTQWGTVLATEETDDGAVYEILDPVTTTGEWIADRATGDIRISVGGTTTSSNIVKRDALVIQAWEGLDILDNGVVIGGDERRPSKERDGGTIFKFVPKNLFKCGAGATAVKPGYLCPNTIKTLAESPLASGKNYALQAYCTGDNDFGQGCESGRSKWLAITSPSNATLEAYAAGATGYCRPEDLAIDSDFGVFGDGSYDADAALFKSTFKKDAGIRWCWTNTCAGGGGEVMCAIEAAGDISAQAEVQINGKMYLATKPESANVVRFWVKRFNEADGRIRAHDNIDIQPFSQMVYVIEDATWGEIWACMKDGADRDQVSDGCVSMLSVADEEAEPSGFAFDASGTVAYYNIQHGSQTDDLLDFVSNPVDGYTDDLMKITGFKVPSSMCPGVVTGFALLEAPGGKKIGAINNGLPLDLCGLPAGLTIEAEVATCGTAKKTSVKFSFRGVERATAENSYPYLVAGGNGRKGAAPVSPAFSVGETVTVMATPYEYAGGFGKSGKSLSATFTVTNSCPARRLGEPN